MPNSMPESDWKHLRLVKKAALDRFCHRVLSDVRSLIASPGSDMHERYLAMFSMVRENDKELAVVFNDMGRSTALFKLAAMRLRGLVSDEEFARFSPQTRESVTSLLDLKNRI